MAKADEIRRSGMSDPDLTADCRQRLVALRRDQADLADDGVSGARLDTFEGAIKTFAALPADILDEQFKRLEKERRDTEMEALRTPLRALRGPVEDVYGDRSAQYRALGLAELADLNEADLLRAAVTATAAAALHLQDPRIVAEGLTQARIDAVAPAVERLETAIGAYNGRVLSRSLNAQERVRQHNALHDECAVLCAKGFRQYAFSDPKRADDYVRDPAPGAAPVPPTA